MKKEMLLAVLVFSVLAISPGCNRSKKVTTPDGTEITVNEKGDQIDTTIVMPDGKKMTMKQDGEKGEMVVTGPDGRKMRIKGNDGGFEMTGPDGKKMTMRSSASGVALPDDFPKDVPVFPDATPFHVQKFPGMTNVVLKTGKTTTEAVDYYTKALKDGQWQTNTTSGLPGSTMIIAMKGELVLNLTINKDKEAGGETVIVLQVSKK
jgi:hypothetical protein